MGLSYRNGLECLPSYTSAGATTQNAKNLPISIIRFGNLHQPESFATYTETLRPPINLSGGGSKDAIERSAAWPTNVKLEKINYIDRDRIMETKFQNLVAFLPCRAGSQRVKNKNTKRFSTYEYGLLQKKLENLCSIDEIDEIVVSTNDQAVIKIVEVFQKLDRRIIIDVRPDELCSNITTTDELIRYVAKTVKANHILWTHVTSPFLEADHYRLIIKQYWLSLSQGYDSLMTVKKLRTFLWNASGPINYDRDELKWPMTQNLPTYFEVDSGVFLAPAEIYKQKNDRIGNNVYMYPNEGLQAMDIDWEGDFVMAQKIQNSINVTKSND